MRYMVIETFTRGARPVYERARDRGRMLPDGLEYVESWVEPGLRARLWVLFGLGGLQGAVGWWMVASGLSERTSVAHERLAFHLTTSGEDVARAGEVLGGHLW